MKQFSHPKPVLILSKCIECEACRYDGAMITNPYVRFLKTFVETIPVCPEMEIGLGVPREPLRIIQEDNKKILYQPATKTDLTTKMHEFTNTFIQSLPQFDGILLKFRSPSCGLSNVKIYKGHAKQASHFKGPGIFAEKIMDTFKYMPMDDEGRLRDFTLREHFLTHLYTRTRFREIKKTHNIQHLVHFHASHKYLFMAYNQQRLRIMGKIVANHAKKPFTQILKEYESHLDLVFSKPARFNSIINSLEHIFGYFSKKINQNERNFFLNSIEEYRDERIPLSVCLHILTSWAIRFNETYLLDQTFLQPFPRDLVQVSDSGKGRKY